MEFGLFTFNNYWFKGREGEVAFKNDRGVIDLVGTSDDHISFIANQLENASNDMKNEIVDPKSGVEAYMMTIQTLDGDYSSDNSFTEKDFEAKAQSLKSKKQIKINAE